MRTYLYRFEIGGFKGVARVDARSRSVADKLADKLVLMKSNGGSYFIWALN